jgi:hypothetical protein
VTLPYTSSKERPLQYAARCRYLRVTLGTPGGNLLNLCQHIIREGRECVGPFLDDHETDCGLWEPNTGDHAHPVTGR